MNATEDQEATAREYYALQQRDLAMRRRALKRPATVRTVLENVATWAALLAFSLGFWWLVWTWIASGLPYPRTMADEPGWDEYVAACGPHGTHEGEDVCLRWDDLSIAASDNLKGATR